MAGIFWISIVWIMPLITFLLINETRFKKNIVIGVTLPFEAREDARVLEALGRFKKWEWIACAVMVAIAGLGWAFEISSMFFILLWIDLCIVVPYIPYFITNTALKKIKREKGWGITSFHKKVRVNTDAIPQGRWISAWVFLPPVIMCMVPMIFDRTLWMVNLTMAVCCGLFWLGYRYCYRNKSEMVDNDVELTQLLTQVRRKGWATMWIITAYGTAALMVGMSITSYSALWSAIVVGLFTVILVSACLYVELKIRKLQETLTAQSGQTWYVDEDENWIGGVLYYNTNDSRLMINNRVGMNTGVNAAHPVGKVLTVILILFLVLLPFLGFFIGGDSFELGFENGEVYSIYGRTEYRIHCDEIVSVKLLEDLPHMTRNFGTGFPTLLQGRFSAEEIGPVRICLNPELSPYLFIETEEEGVFILGGYEAGEAEQIYHEMESVME